MFENALHAADVREPRAEPPAESAALEDCNPTLLLKAVLDAIRNESQRLEVRRKTIERVDVDIDSEIYIEKRLITLARYEKSLDLVGEVLANSFEVEGKALQMKKSIEELMDFFQTEGLDYINRFSEAERVRFFPQAIKISGIVGKWMGYFGNVNRELLYDIERLQAFRRMVIRGLEILLRDENKDHILLTGVLVHTEQLLGFLKSGWAKMWSDAEGFSQIESMARSDLINELVGLRIEAEL